jgi:hypothetical protein
VPRSEAGYTDAVVRSSRLFLLAAVAILFYQLMLPPVIGVANNGDFSRIYGIFHLTMPVADEYGFAATKFQFDSKVDYFGGFYSSEMLFLPPALALNSVFSKDGSFDVRTIGFVHGGVFLLALFLFLPLLDGAPRKIRWTVSIVILLVFCDVMYAGYLNSFYSDVAAYLFLLLSVVLTLRVLLWWRRGDAILLVISGILLATSKAQHAPLGILLALMLLAMSRKSGRWMAVAAGGLACLSALWLWKSTPVSYSARGCFSVVFARILPHASDAGRTLRELGLDESYRPYIGMVSYSAGSPMDDGRFVEDFRRRVSYASLAWYFTTHPRDTYVALRTSLDEAGRHRPVLGNFDRSAGLPPYTESHAFAWWSDWKRMVFEHRGSRFLTCFAGLAVVAGLLLVLERRYLPPGAVLVGGGLVAASCTELVVSSLADAMDVPRHHLVFYATCDLLSVLVLYLAWGRWARAYHFGVKRVLN